MADQKNRDDEETGAQQQTRYTLLHLIAAQLASGLTDKRNSPKDAVSLYHQVYIKLTEANGLNPDIP